MGSFTWNDIVTVAEGAPAELRPGAKAWIVGFTDKDSRRGAFLNRYPEGRVYTIEYEDGSSAEVHESQLAIFKG